MAKFESTINGGSFVRVGVILAILGVAFWFVQGRNATPSTTQAEPVAVTSPSAEVAPVELLPGATVWIDTVVGKVPLTIVAIANGQATLTDADGDTHVMSANALAWGALVDDIDQADERAALMVQVVEQRRVAGFYAAHAPVGWCDAADCPPTLTVQRQAQPQAVGMAPGRVTNYVPEHWPSEVRAALQYPAGLNAQQWANEHLYNR